MQCLENSDLELSDSDILGDITDVFDPDFDPNEDESNSSSSEDQDKKTTNDLPQPKRRTLWRKKTFPVKQDTVPNTVSLFSLSKTRSYV